MIGQQNYGATFWHGLLPKAPFFLIATPDHFYFWENAGDAPEESEPSYDIDPRTMNGSTFKPDDKVGEFEFESKVASWFNAILNSPPEKTNGAIGEILSRSGLSEAIRGGRLAFESRP